MFQSLLPKVMFLQPEFNSLPPRCPMLQPAAASVYQCPQPRSLRHPPAWAQLPGTSFLLPPPAWVCPDGSPSWESTLSLTALLPFPRLLPSSSPSLSPLRLLEPGRHPHPWAQGLRVGRGGRQGWGGARARCCLVGGQPQTGGSRA